MSESRLLIRKLAEAILASGGKIPLSSLVENVVPVQGMRVLARKFGLSPKGGFRVERAPARVLAPLLAEVREPDRLDEVLETLLDELRKPAGKHEPPAEDAKPSENDLEPVLKLRERELSDARRELDRARVSAARAQERAEQLVRDLAAAEENLARLRGELDQSRRRGQQRELPVGDRDLTRRAHELERDLESYIESESALRRLLALRAQRIRELEEQVTELDELLPKGRRRRKARAEALKEPERRFILPHFTPAFYKSLEGKDRRSVDRAFQAILLFCTEGHSYPGLEAKQLGGQDLWSLRASLRLRVYFQNRVDGDAEILALADREDQNTTLRRLKER